MTSGLTPFRGSRRALRNQSETYMSRAAHPRSRFWLTHDTRCTVAPAGGMTTSVLLHVSPFVGAACGLQVPDIFDQFSPAVPLDVQRVVVCPLEFGSLQRLGLLTRAGRLPADREAIKKPVDLLCPFQVIELIQSEQRKPKGREEARLQAFQRQLLSSVPLHTLSEIVRHTVIQTHLAVRREA